MPADDERLGRDNEEAPAVTFYGGMFKASTSCSSSAGEMNESTTAGEDSSGTAADTENASETVWQPGFFRHGEWQPRERTRQELRQHLGGRGQQRSKRRQERMEAYFQGLWRPAWLENYRRERERRNAGGLPQVQEDDEQIDEPVEPVTRRAQDEGSDPANTTTEGWNPHPVVRDEEDTWKGEWSWSWNSWQSTWQWQQPNSSGHSDMNTPWQQTWDGVTTWAQEEETYTGDGEIEPTDDGTPVSPTSTTSTSTTSTWHASCASDDPVVDVALMLTSASSGQSGSKLLRPPSVGFVKATLPLSTSSSTTTTTSTSTTFTWHALTDLMLNTTTSTSSAWDEKTSDEVLRMSGGASRLNGKEFQQPHLYGGSSLVQASPFPPHGRKVGGN